MRLWSVHPQHLDSKGLVALWREGLLAQAVLAGKTQGYKNHPQLDRFKAKRSPLKAIGVYLYHVHQESLRRGYSFDGSKIIEKAKTCSAMTVTKGQLDFEWDHLRKKLLKRDPVYLQKLGAVAAPHPLLTVVPGGVEEWER